MKKSTKYFTWTFSEGRIEWPSWETWRAHWLIIAAEPHAQYWEERQGY